MKKITLAIFALLNIIALTSFAQQTDTLKQITLGEIVISVNKIPEPQKNVAQTVQIIAARQIQNIQALSTAELISASGIQVQKSQLGGGSPVLRGFEASRIVLVLDGVRLNNLIYRAGHLQDIVKTDNNSIDRIEVLYGPSSTVYGSDALGGVIHMYTKKPLLASGDKLNVKANLFSRYESACNGLTEHVDFNIGGKRFASLTSFSYSKFGDLIGGKSKNPFYKEEYGTRPDYVEYLGNGKDTLMTNSNKYLQVGSGYSQYDIIQKFLFQQNKHLSHNLNLQYSNSTDVPRYDRLTDRTKTGLKSAEWYYGPQMRMLAAYDLNYSNPEGLFDEVHFGLNYQGLEESRHNRNFNSKSRSNRIENVSVIGANLDFRKKVSAHDIRFGLDAQLNSLVSTANKENIIDNTSVKLDSRYPDGDNTMNNFALYFSHLWRQSDEFAIVDGLRLGYSTLHSTLVDTAIMFHLPYTDIKQNTPVWSGNLGFIATPNDRTKLSFMVSTGYRVPNVDDVAKVFGSAEGMVIVPNPDLKPEQTINYELGFTKLFGNSVRWDNSFFYTQYYNMAVVDVFTFNGKDSLMYDGTMSRVYANVNKEKGYISGFSTEVMAALGKHFTWTTGATYTYGRIETENGDLPLDHIPPFMARTSLKYITNKFSGDFFILYNGWKHLKDYYPNGEDNEQYATPEGMSAWMTANLRLSYQLHKFVAIQAGIDNILDTQYRTFASGINAPGRNFIISLRGTF